MYNPQRKSHINPFLSKHNISISYIGKEGVCSKWAKSAQITHFTAEIIAIHCLLGKKKKGAKGIIHLWRQYSYIYIYITYIPKSCCSPEPIQRKPLICSQALPSASRVHSPLACLVEPVYSTIKFISFRATLSNLIIWDVKNYMLLYL